MTRPRGRGPVGVPFGWDQVDNYIPGAAAEVGEVGWTKIRGFSWDDDMTMTMNIDYGLSG